MNDLESPPLIDIKNLYFAYEKEDVLVDINLTVPQGTTLGIVGPNGGGKTTLLKIILGLLKGYRGQVTVRCRYDSTDPHHHRCIGYVPQKSTINRTFPATVSDAVEMGLYGLTGPLGPTKSEKEYVRWLIGQTGIESIKNSSIMEISGGQLQRTLIARALVAKPALLVLDEPLVGIDESGVLQFIDLLMSLKAELNLTVLMVSHNFDALAMFADRVSCINRTMHSHENPGRLTQKEIQGIFSCGFDAYQKVRGPRNGPGEVS